MRTKVFAAVLLVVVGVVALSATRNTQVREALLPTPSAAEAALDRVVPDLHFEALPFDEAIRRLEVAAGVEVRVDWARLRHTGFDCKAPVQLRVRGDRLSDALSRLLAQLHARESARPPGFAPDGGTVLVSTEDALAGQVFVRCYDIRDLLPPQAPPEPRPAKPNPPTGVGLFGNQQAALPDEPGHEIGL